MKSLGQSLPVPADPQEPLPPMPSPMAKELLESYGDVLRVGRLKVNGDVVSWVTEGTTRQQLQNFCDVVSVKLRSLPELAGLAACELWRAIFLYCKAVSMNYAVIDVLLLLCKEYGEMCAIESRNVGGASLLSYGLKVVRDAHGALLLCPRLKWKGRNNVVTSAPACDSFSATACDDENIRHVMGTLKRIETSFPLPPPPGHVPSYSLKLRTAPTKASMRNVCSLLRDLRRPRALIPNEPLCPTASTLSFAESGSAASSEASAASA